MCYRYSNNVKSEGTLLNRYRLRLSERMEAVKAFEEKFHFYHTNGYSFEKLPVITMDSPDEVQLYQWGLIPFWVKTAEQAAQMQKQTLNAKSETIFEKPSFRGSILKKRCLVPATGFFDWRHEGKEKYPYHVMVKDGSLPDTVRSYSFAGIYDRWIDEERGGEVHDTFSIITTPANKLMEYVHNSKMRMPLILKEEDEEAWLCPDLTREQVTELMRPYPSDLMVAHTITKRITAQNLNPNVPEVLEPAAYIGLDAWYETSDC